MSEIRRGRWIRPGVAAASLVVVAIGSFVAGYAYVRHQLPDAPWQAASATAPLDGVPVHLVWAFLAAEDARYFEHDGVDGRAVLRAMAHNLVSDDLQGGSTITQQTAKLMLGDRERTMWRKIRETVLARELEEHLTKPEILDLYLRSLYLGDGARGIDDAAQVYFDKRVRELSVAEAALLAAIPKSPARFSPHADPDAAAGRRDWVLARMVDHGWITAEQREVARATPVPTR